MTEAPPARTGVGPSALRETNSSLVLDMLISRGPMSRTEIGHATSLAKPTISGIIDQLMRNGLVQEVGVGPSTVDGGRPPILLDFNARSQSIVGIHIGVRTTTIALADATGKEFLRHAIATPKAAPRRALSRIADEVLAVVNDAELPVERLTAVGVVLPGLTDFEAGVCRLAPNLGWRDVPVRDLLSSSLGVPVFVHHTGQAAVVAEHVEGAGQGHNDLVLLYVGSGLGTGVLADGRVYHGHGGVAGELGHCQLPGLEEPCMCGKRGCLETITNAPALLRMVRKRTSAGRRSVLTGLTEQELTPGRVKEAALARDVVAVEAVEELAKNLGLAASWLLNVFNPEMLVLGGGLADFGDLLLAPMRNAATELGLKAAVDDIEIVLSRLGEDAEVRGATLLALQQARPHYQHFFSRERVVT